MAQRIYRLQRNLKVKLTEDDRKEKQLPPDGVLQTPVEKNLMNLWTILTEPPIKIRKIADIPLSQNYDGVFAIKECECPIQLNGEPLMFRVYCLVKESGDCYVYAQTYVTIYPDEYFVVKDCDCLSEGQVDKIISEQSGGYSRVLKYQLFDSIKAFIQLFRGELTVGANCKNCFELFEFQFQAGFASLGQPYHFLVDVIRTPKLKITNCFAQILFPRIVDDMYALTIDQVFETPTYLTQQHKSQLEIAKEQYESDLVHQRLLKPGEHVTEEQAMRRIHQDQRVLDGLRYSGGRHENGFFQILEKWNPCGTQNRKK